MAMTAESLRGPLRFTIDLTSGLIQQPIRPQLMKGDKRANTIIVEMTEEKKPADLSGVTVTGSFISPMDGAEIPLTGHVENGNEAHVTLIDECYAQEGYFEANVKLTFGETSRTILSFTGHVLSKGSGAVIDIGDVIPSIDDIIAQYQAMRDAVESTNAAGAAAATAAASANEAAEKAEDAARKIDGMTVDAVSGLEANASISEQNGVKHITFTLPKGEKGDKGEKGEPGRLENAEISSINGLQEALDDKLSVTGTAADSAKLGGKAPECYTNPRDLLVNSDFTNIVNQRGVASGTVSSSSAVFIDRWMTYQGIVNNMSYEFNDDGLRLVSQADAGGTYGITQKLPNLLRAGQAYTLAAMIDNTVYAGSFYPNESGNITIENFGFGFFVFMPAYSGYNSVNIRFTDTGGAHTIRWVALYEGEYTAETLPPYVPKGYGAEWTECRRYFRAFSEYRISTVGAALIFEIEHEGMHEVPDVIINHPSTGELNKVSNYVSAGSADISIQSAGKDRTIIKVSGTDGSTYFYRLQIDGGL